MRRRNLRIIDTLQVATPCIADWELMVGDDKSRFCKACEKHVYNLPALEEDELVELIQRTEGKFCGRLYARRDGTVLTNDCPIGLAAKLAETRRRRRIGAAAAVAALMIAAGGMVLGAAFGGTSISRVDPMIAGGIVEMPPPDIKGEISIVEEEVVEPEPRPLMGKIAAPDHLRAK